MKKIKIVLSLLLCTLFIPIVSTPANAISTKVSTDCFVEKPAETAEILKLSESDFNNMVSRIFEAVANSEVSCDIADYKIDYSMDVYMALYELVFGNPEFFHVDRIICYYSSDYQVTELEFIYLYTKDEYTAMLQEVRDAAVELTVGITDDLCDAEKALVIHDRLAANCEYDYDNIMMGTVPIESYTLYGALATDHAVCQGYAKAMVYLLNLVGINSYTCSSDQLNHMWVIAYIDGEKYHIDTTWDDPVLNMNGRSLHSNFLVSTSALKRTAPVPHAATDYDVTPVSEKYDNYFWKNIESAFCLFKGKLYYMDNASKTLCEYDFNTDTSTPVLKISEKWMASATTWWSSNFTKLATDGQKLYYSLPDGIYSFNPATSKSESVFIPDMSDHELFSIYGFKLSKGKLVCQAYATPNITPYTETETYIYTLPQKPQGTASSGDITSDGVVAVDDALVVLRVAASIEKLTDDILAKGDMDGDGKITVADALVVLRIAVNLA